MRDPDDDTVTARDDGLTARDDTIVAGASAGETPDNATRRIRPSRPSLAPSSGNYPELTVVDPAHYVLLREIARGGMGRILVARDRRLGREVAVKEVLVQSGSIARRFEREARITAQLQHPSIISVHEAGTWPSGEPFYAMRLVTGRSLDEAIAAAPSYAERLALLPSVLAVADAMAYAHGKRVIHRDLKPRNVVVGEFGETVVIDWGLAKDLSAPDAADSIDPDPQGAPKPTEIGGSNPSQGETVAGEVLGTPAYMPPEQAEGRQVDERADVYAIGALLYHLIAGRAPFVADSDVALLAAVHLDAPTPLRELVPDVASELVAIAERAMAREPGDRYPTARHLADDLRRFQTGQLVGAHRYSLRHLIRRWVRRHRTAIAALSAAAIVAIGISVVAVRRVVAAEALAQDERAAALAHQKDAEELMQFMLVDLQGKLAPVGKLDLLDAVARRAATYYDARGDTGSDEDIFLSAIARAGVGRVIEARGDLPGALAEYAKARASLERLAAAHPDVAKYEQRALDVASRVGDIQETQGEGPAALATFRELLARAERALAATPNDVTAIHDVFTLHSRIAGNLESQGDLEPALAEYRVTLELANRRATLEHTAATDKDLLNAHAHVGRLLGRAKHDLAGALAEYRTALAIGEHQAELDPKNPSWLQDVAISHDEVGTILKQQKDLPAALAEYRAGLATAERAVAIDPSNTEMVSTRATLGEKVGIALFEQHDLPGALAEFSACEAIWVDLSARDPSNLEHMRGRSVIDNKLGDVQLAAKDTTAALASYRNALALRERMLAKDPANSAWRRDLFYSHYKLAKAYREVPDRPQVIAELRAAIAIAEITAAAHPTNESFADDVAESHDELGDELAVAGDAAGAAGEYRAGIAIARTMAGHPGADPDWTTLADKMAGKLGRLPTSR